MLAVAGSVFSATAGCVVSATVDASAGAAAATSVCVGNHLGELHLFSGRLDGHDGRPLQFRYNRRVHRP
jgi:hypothetical protein